MLLEYQWSLLGLVGLFLSSIVLWRLAPAERRRVRFIWGLSLAAALLWLATRLPDAPRWIAEVDWAIAEIIVLHLAVIILFHIVLGRLKLPRILSDIVVGGGYIAILLGLLTRIGVNLTGIIATSAVATAVIGFGVQDLLGNLAGGLVLELERSIAEGDWIKVDHFVGRVRTVRMRHTALETPDGDTVLAPNSMLVRSPVTVLGRIAGAGPTIKSRRLLTFQLPYGYSPPAVLETVQQALRATPMDGIATDPPPRCILVEYHPQHVKYGAFVWISRPGLELLDVSGVRSRISFALSRMGAPLSSIPFVVDQRVESAAPVDTEAADRLAALRHIEIFQVLKDDEVNQLASRMQRLSFAAGEPILRQGEAGDSAFIIKSGRVRILISNASGLSEQVACLAPGDFFGEMSLLTGERRNATALALDQVDCYRIGKPDLDVVFAGRPELAGDISALLAARHAGLVGAQEKLSAETARQDELANKRDLLSRIRRYFSIDGE